MIRSEGSPAPTQGELVPAGNHLLEPKTKEQVREVHAVPVRLDAESLASSPTKVL